MGGAGGITKGIALATGWVPWLGEAQPPCLSKLSVRINLVVVVGRLPDLILWIIRPFMVWPASGAAVSTELDDAVGGGVGLHVRNRG
jgi:hypothetical protein